MQTRRALLGGIAGASALLAGCQGAPTASSGQRTGDASTTRTDDASTPDAAGETATDATETTSELPLEPGVGGVGTDLARWVPAQSIPAFISRIPEPRTGPYYVTAIDVPAILAYKDTLGTPQGDQSIFDPATSEGQAGVDLTESLYIKAGPQGAPYLFVFDGGVEPATRIDAVTANPNLTESGTVDGYTVVAAENAGAYAIGDATQVAAANVTNGAAVVRSAIQGDTRTYADENDTFAALLDALGGGEAVGGILRPDEDVAGLRAYGRAYTYGGETTTLRYASVFDPETASVGAVESFTESQFDGSPRVRRGDGVVVAEQAIPTAEVGYPTHTEL
ncbi:hypothetical protein [Halorientalis regularis]|uniref:Uncharacterized protein n=1 Tax=Halorientalis regularis TaxID=660518 RepID=A0A1G7MF09_9EURY|nr:hypothetical protein [Halorientalis regularis]SDF60184.1 hypothetical protein SAMN05216218_107242 [Halorientalis regularis]